MEIYPGADHSVECTLRWHCAGHCDGCGGAHFLSAAMGLKTCYIQNFDYDIIEIEIGFFRLSIFSVILME